MHIDALSTHLIYLLTFFILLGESGVFFLFFLPGDSLLFALGLLANQGTISLWYIIPLLIVAAIAGNMLGYWMGTKMRQGLLMGKKYLPKVKPEHMERAERFYTKYGIYAVFFARFVPVVRTIVPFFAGVVAMRKRVFSLWSVVGGIVWISVVITVGFFFGKQFNFDHIAQLGVGVILVAVVATPVFLKLLKRFA